MATNSGLSNAQNAYYQALLDAGQSDPNALMNYVGQLNDYQALASLANTQGKFAPINAKVDTTADILRQVQDLETMYNTPINTGLPPNTTKTTTGVSGGGASTGVSGSVGSSGGGTSPTVTATTTTSPVNQFSAGPSIPTLPESNDGRNWSDPQTVGASNGQLMGAGNANYNSSLIKSLRQSSMNPFSTNPGVQMTPNSGQTTVNWTPPSGTGSAFNPQVMNPRAASPQEVTDWNAYNAYRSSSVSASNPYLSLTDWIAQGRPTGVNNTSSSSGNNQSYDGGIG